MLDNASAARLDSLAEAAEAYVQHAFGRRLELMQIAPSNLPHFILDRYKLWSGSLSERSLIVLAVLEPRQGTISDYLKHRDLVRRQLHAEIVILLVDQTTAALRRQMVDRQIGFLAPGAQLYIPEALLDLRERAPASVPVGADDPISPTTQLLLFAHLHRLAINGASLTELARKFDVSIMSMSRSLDELEALQIAKAHLDGRRRLLSMAVGGRELWDVVCARLQSPVRKVRFVTGFLTDEVAPRAGETMLAAFTMLAEPRTITRAIAAAEWKAVESGVGLKSATAFDDDRLRIETWSYDPKALAREGVVDRLSLYLTVRSAPDERVAEAANTLLEMFEW